MRTTNYYVYLCTRDEQVTDIIPSSHFYISIYLSISLFLLFFLSLSIYLSLSLSLFLSYLSLSSHISFLSPSLPPLSNLSSRCSYQVFIVALTLQIYLLYILPSSPPSCYPSSFLPLSLAVQIDKFLHCHEEIH